MSCEKFAIHVAWLSVIWRCELILSWCILEELNICAFGYIFGNHICEFGARKRNVLSDLALSKQLTIQTMFSLMLEWARVDVCIPFHYLTITSGKDHLWLKSCEGHMRMQTNWGYLVLCLALGVGHRLIQGLEVLVRSIIEWDHSHWSFLCYDDVLIKVWAFSCWGWLTL